MKSIVVIPVYKPKPELNEIHSFIQCLKILYKHPICIITYQDLNISYYTNLLAKFKIKFHIEYFDSTYFQNIYGYNKLMLSLDFYKRFNSFIYILIYQLDSWVFRDELDYWCQKGYDYIGAPWLVEKENRLSIEGFAGNGGFSLRRISSFVRTLEIKKKIVLNPLEILQEYLKSSTRSLFLKVPLIAARIFGYRNNTEYFRNINNRKEDMFWANLGSKINKDFTVIQGQEAIGFAFERYPGYLYKLNNYNLPFGCHGWAKHDKEFWLKHISCFNDLLE